MTEEKALAYVNMWGVLGSLETLCAIDDIAKSVLEKLSAPVSLCFSVKDGPTNTFHFSKDGCRMTYGDKDCNRKMVFASPEAFNKMIASGKPGLPIKRPIGTLAFLAGTFTALTNRLEAVLRTTPEELEKDAGLFEENTLMTLSVLSGAISALADYDSISRISASGCVDGSIQLGIKDKMYVTLVVKNHRFYTKRAKAKNPRAVMEFADIELAHGLFGGTVSTVNEMCRGAIYLSGMLSMMDNVNRIMDRAAVYLA